VLGAIKYDLLQFRLVIVRAVGYLLGNLISHLITGTPNLTLMVILCHN